MKRLGLALESVATNRPCGTYVQEAEAFYERIKSNYEWIDINITATDLIYQPLVPVITRRGEGPYSIVMNQSVQNIKNIQDIQNISNNQQTILRVMNQLLSRIYLYLDGKATYQDQAFISAMLRRFGIYNQDKFMNVLRLVKVYGDENPYEQLVESVAYNTKGQMQSKMAAAILVNLVKGNWGNYKYNSAYSWISEGERLLSEVVENTTERFFYYHLNPDGYDTVKQSLQELKKERELVQMMFFEEQKQNEINHLELFYVVVNSGGESVSSTANQQVPSVRKEQIRNISKQVTRKEQRNMRTEDRNLNLRSEENRSIEELKRAFQRQMQESLEEQVHTRVQKQVQSQVQTQMNVLTDKVYGQLERRLINEKKRRGL